MFCVTAGYGEQFGRVIATPGVSEKGYMDVMINVASPGGHSSLPPPHTVCSCHFRNNSFMLISA